jgi:protein-tyrosine-phosphatase
VDTFSIIFICTGNRFRSPLAAAFVHQLTLDLPVTTESYGILPRENAPALAEAVELARLCDISLSDHRTRYLNNASLEEVDLVLGFEPAHVQQAVVDARAPRERSFTIRDFVALLPTVQLASPGESVVEQGRSLVAVAAQRFAERPGPAMMRSLPDPFGGSWKVYRQSASDVRDLSVALVERLFGVSAARGLSSLPGKMGTMRKFWR